MQRIERYGVIALVFLLVTILAVSLWGESKGDGWFSKLTAGRTTESTRPPIASRAATPNRAAQLSATGGEQPLAHDRPGRSAATNGIRPRARR